MLQRAQSLWGALVLLVFLVMLLSSLLLATILFINFKLGLIEPTRFHGFWFIVGIMLTSIVVGTLLTGLFGRRILFPFGSLNTGTKEVAKGNFQFRLYEDYRIEELREMAHNFNVMVQELSGIETLRNDFIINVSHEFKTPIAAIEGYATLIQDADLPHEERKEYTRLIMESTKQLSALSSHILKLSKLENQEILAEREAFQLDEQLRLALLLLEPQWSVKQLNLELQLEAIRFYGSEELLMQVWVNLLGNAIKFSDTGDELTIVATQTVDEVRVEIGDTGIGMTPNVRKHIFEKFYQGDQSRSAEGNGLGLPLALRIVDLHQGRIEATSELGKGSTFTVRMPRVEE
jgi:signal transduction histidine kinase